MAMETYTLDENYQLINSGAATIQKITRGYGAVMVYFGSAAPTDDTKSMLLDSNDPHFFQTADDIYARTPHGVPVEIVVGA